MFARVFAEDGNTQTAYNHVMATTRSAVIDSNAIMRNILVIRGHRVLLDSDLAALYQVETKALTRTVRRNADGDQSGYSNGFQKAVDRRLRVKAVSPFGSDAILLRRVNRSSLIPACSIRPILI